MSEAWAPGTGSGGGGGTPPVRPWCPGGGSGMGMGMPGTAIGGMVGLGSAQKMAEDLVEEVVWFKKITWK